MPLLPDAGTLPTIMRLRVTLRLLEDAPLPPYKGGLLRGGFGYAFQRTACVQPCWGQSERCAVATLCPYRWVFETPRPPGVEHLHDLQDIPRPFVIEPPLSFQRQYRAGEALEFGLVLIGRGRVQLPYFLASFEELGRMGLGRAHAKYRLERVEVLRPWQPFGQAVYQDGRASEEALRVEDLPHYDAAAFQQRAAVVPADLVLHFPTPLRVKARGVFLEDLDLPALMRAIGWRLNTLALFHTETPGQIDYRAVIEQAASVTVAAHDLRWADWERTSTRNFDQRQMKLGGLVGSATLRGVPLDVRTMLLIGSLIHAGKACTFGHGLIEVRPS